jgi:hypothetical protein
MTITDSQLLAYTREESSAEELRQIEAELRSSPELQLRLEALLMQSTNGMHSVREIWRTNRLSCPTRSDWGRYLLNILQADEREYFEFHLQDIQCPYCQSNLEDLKAVSLSNPAADTHDPARAERLFQSSIGHLNQFIR